MIVRRQIGQRRRGLLRLLRTGVGSRAAAGKYQEARDQQETARRLKEAAQRRQREIVINRTTALCRSEYEWGVHIAAFGEGLDGEIYILDFDGGPLHRLVPAPPAPDRPAFPTRLSETGLFASTKDHTLAAGLVPYSVNAPQWTDDGIVERFVAGINAYVAETRSGARPLPVEFGLTLSTPDTWKADDVLRIRSHALVSNVTSEVARARAVLAFQMNPSLDPTVAQTLIDGQVEQAYYKTKIATAAQSAADLLRQNIMINLVQDTSSIVGQKLNDPASLMIATARANAIEKPASKAGVMVGATTAAMVRSLEAPSVAAASSTSLSRSCSTGCTVRTTNGMLVKAIATAIPSHV